jgi:hypothetical protein
MPKPVNPRDMLAREFSAAAREEIKHDGKTGKPYRVNHAFQTSLLGETVTRWVDIDEAPRHRMQASMTSRREQVVGDIVQLSLDIDHWNGVNPDDQPIIVQTDFMPDVEWRKNAPDDMAA